MPANVRDSQRVSRSCIRCAHRKVKCSKKIPCEQCIRRGDAASCTREVVRVGGKVTVAIDDEETQDSDIPSTSNLLLENRSLRNRIRQMESALSRPELLKVDMAVARPATASHNFQSSEGILSNFQMQAFGLSAEPTREHNGHARRWDDSVKLILPTRRWSETITQFSLLHLGWVHCALDATTFSKEHDAFWNSLIEGEQDSLTKHGWVAVYLSVLAVGVYFIGEENIQDLQLLYESFSSQCPSNLSSLGKSCTGLCRTWYAAALRELDNADYTRKASVLTVQALAILNIVHKNLGESSREYILHGVAVNVARLVGIDHLGGNSDPSNAAASDVIALNDIHRNVYRRLWWTLVICDWMIIYSRPVSIDPDSFTTVLEIRDDVLNSPSPLEYHKVMARIAIMMRNHTRLIKDWTIDSVRSFFEELDSVSMLFPPHLSYHGHNDSACDAGGEQLWNTVQRHLVFNCLDSWRINLFVAMIPRLLDGPAQGGHSILQDGILAAKRILQRRKRDPCQYFNKFWSSTCAVVTAGIFLALDLICFQKYQSSSEVAEEKEFITFSYKLIELSSTEARHGALLVLSRLVHLYEVVLSPSHPVNRGALARIVRLVAFPRLWDSLSDTDATLRYLFVESSSMSERGSGTLPSMASPEINEDVVQRGTPSNAANVGTFDPCDVHMAFGGQSETVPYFEDFFPSAEFIDTSLPWLDPSTHYNSVG